MIPAPSALEVHGKVGRPVLVEVEDAHPDRPWGIGLQALATSRGLPRRQAEGRFVHELPVALVDEDLHEPPVIETAPLGADEDQVRQAVLVDVDALDIEIDMRVPESPRAAGNWVVSASAKMPARFQRMVVRRSGSRGTAISRHDELGQTVSVEIGERRAGKVVRGGRVQQLIVARRNIRPRLRELPAPRVQQEIRRRSGRSRCLQRCR